MSLTGIQSVIMYVTQSAIVVGYGPSGSSCSRCQDLVADRRAPGVYEMFRISGRRLGIAKAENMMLVVVLCFFVVNSSVLPVLVASHLQPRPKT